MNQVNQEIRECNVCLQIFPLTNEHFQIHRCTQKGKTTIYFRKYCRDCENTKRRKKWSQIKDSLPESQKETRRKAVKKYLATEKGKAVQKRCFSSPKWKEYMKKRQQESVDKMTPGYLKRLLRTKLGKDVQITPQLLDLQKKSLIISRQIHNRYGREN
jgi:hypothetical protein